MLEAGARAILDRLSDEDLVLDVGGWADPFARADWVLDLMPYETRGRYGGERGEPAPSERFSRATWVQRDMCDREPWPFADDQFDFAICAQTLEDVRDPVWACSELTRVARAGYVETPSRAAEQTWWIEGPWAGWSHHHWLVEVHGDRIEFTLKPHSLHARPDFQLARETHDSLAAEQRVETLWWTGGFAAREIVHIGADGLYPWLAEVPARFGARPARTASRRRSIARRLLGRR